MTSGASRVGLVWGALIVAAGVALARSLGLRLRHRLSVPLAGLDPIFFGRRTSHLPVRTAAWGVILIVVGVVFQLNKSRLLLRFSFADLWPLAIIGVGS